MVKCCRSSVVERILGKAEVVSSILTGSTIFPFIVIAINGVFPARRNDVRLA